MLSGLAVRLAKVPAFRVLQSATKLCFSRYLLITNTALTVCLSGTGDILEQRYEIYKKRQDVWEPMRTAQICTTGLFIGPMCHFWYLFLDKYFPGRALRMVAKKILIDQIVFSPVNISGFLILMGWLEGASNRKIKHELMTDGPRLLKAEWLVWPPAQMINFYMLPVQYRVLFDNTISLGFDFYYAFVKFDKDKIDIDNPKPSHHFQRQQLVLPENGEYSLEEGEFIEDIEPIYHHGIQHCGRAFRLSDAHS